jgi:protein-disulfide isomerase
VRARTTRFAASKTALVAALLVLFGGVTSAFGADDMASRIIDYYRLKANVPPGVDAKLTGIQDSKLPGIKSATIQLSRGTQTQDIEILMSADGKYVVFSGADRSGSVVGVIEDVTKNPFAEVEAKLAKVTKGRPEEGPKDAKVTIVEFSDFQCPYCARAHQTVAGQVMKEYNGKVKLVYKYFPLAFHKWAESAAIAAECAYEQDQAAFWTLYNYFFQNQQTMTPENVKDKSLEALAGSKVDKDKFTTCYDSKASLPQIKTDMADGQSVGVTGTPAFFINGRRISGAQPFESFKAVIDDELQRANEKS